MKPQYITALAKTVARNFVAAGFSTQDLLQGPITLTDIPWQNPPLHCQEPLGGYAFQDYIDYPTKVAGSELYKFWKWGQEKLYASAQSVCTLEGWKGLSAAMPTASAGERALRFSVPENFPKHHEFSGHVFTLEVVNLFIHSTSDVQNMAEDENNYYIETPYGPIGIVDGTIFGSDLWGADMSGLVDSYLLAQRGFIRTTCRHDLLAKVRSVLHEHAEEFDEFAGMDYALQALATLSQDRLCKELLSAIEGMLPDSFEAKRKIKLVDEALELLDEWTVNDRVKVNSMYEILTPNVYSVGEFHTRIFNAAKPVPTMLQDKTLLRIRNNLTAKRADLLKGVSAKDRKQFERE